MTNNAVRQPDERKRALAAVELRVQGHTYAHIAAQLGYADESGARHAVQRNLDRREAESIDELRAVHSARLEAVLLAFWPAAQGRDTDAARVILRTLDSLAKLHGLYAPTRVTGAPMSTIEFANEAARLIESIASMGATDDLLRSLPDGAGQSALGIAPGRVRRSAGRKATKRSPMRTTNLGRTSAGRTPYRSCRRLTPGPQSDAKPHVVQPSPTHHRTAVTADHGSTVDWAIDRNPALDVSRRIGD